MAYPNGTDSNCTVNGQLAREAVERTQRKAAEEAAIIDLHRKITILRQASDDLDDLYNDISEYVDELEQQRSDTYDVPVDYFYTWRGRASDAVSYSCYGVVDDSLYLYITSYIKEVDNLRDAVNTASTTLVNATYGNCTGDSLMIQLNNTLTWLENQFN